MESAFEIADEMKRRFETARTEDNLRSYVMAELLSPIEDKYHVMDLIKENISIIKDKRLLFLGAEISSGWNPGDKYFINILNQNIDSATEDEKAIIYYLNALEIGSCGKLKNPDIMNQYRTYLQKSVACSAYTYFSNNKYDLAKISPKKEAIKLLEESKNNVKKVLSVDECKKLTYDYFLDIQNYINEFILGVSITSVVFEMRYGINCILDESSK